MGSFTLQRNEVWEKDELELPGGIRVQQEARDWERALPYGLGAVVWDSALAFCELLETLEPHGEGSAAAESGGCGTGHSFWHGKAVLELGAGCGAAGLAAAARGAEVTLSDRAALLPLLERNVALNPRIRARVHALEWEKISASDFVARPEASSSAFDIVLGTDLLDPERVEGREPFEALAGVLSRMLEAAPSCLGLLIFEERGPLRLRQLGGLFAPLARAGALWEFLPPGRHGQRRSGRKATSGPNRLRFLCLHGGAAPAFAEWQQFLGEDAEFVRWQEGDFAAWRRGGS